MERYLDLLNSELFPARTVIPTSETPEWTALLKLCDIIDRERRYARSPGFLDLWTHSVLGRWVAPEGPDRIDLQREDRDSAPTLQLIRGRRSYVFIPLPLDESRTVKCAYTTLRKCAPENVYGAISAIFANRHSEVARTTVESLNRTHPNKREHRWIATDWSEVASIIDRLDEEYHVPALREYAALLKHDFRMPWSVRFSESTGGITVADLLSEPVDSALFGLPDGLIPLLATSANVLLPSHLSRVSDRYTPGRHVMRGARLRPILEGQLSGSWSGISWDTIVGTYPRSIAERIVEHSEPHYRIVDSGTVTTPWDSVQVTSESA